DTRKSARRIDQSDHRHAKFFAQPHQSQRFAVPLRMRATKIAQDVLLCVAPFLMSDNNATFGAECGHTTRHRSIIGKATITMQLDPICKTPLDVIQSERPLHMPRDLDTLPG